MMNYQNKTLKLVGQETFEKLQKYVNLIEHHNKEYNLTGFSGDKLWEEGIYESLVCLDFIANNLKQNNFKLLDIGAGAGFPSIPYLIWKPGTQLTIAEPRKKRCEFLNEVAQNLNLNFEVFCSKVQQNKGSFDMITARAVGSLAMLLDITASFKNTHLAFIKGPKVFEENKEVNEIFEIKKVDEIVNKNIFISFLRKN